MNAFSTHEARTEAAESGAGAQPWDGVWDDCPEVSVRVTEVDGRPPEGLVGTLYRNGPGKRSLSGSYFDGDGMIRALSLTPDGRAHYRARFIHTSKFLANRHARQTRVRSAGTQLPGGPLSNILRMPANEANTHVMEHAGKLLALYEGGAPFELAQPSLDTVGIENFGGGLSKKVAFSAHPHLDPHRGELYNFGLSYGARGTQLCTFKLDRAGHLTKLRRAALPYMTFLHDYGLSQNWMGFVISPVKGSMTKMLLGLESVFEGFRSIPGGCSELILLSRDGRQERRFEIAPQDPAHVIAAREEGDEFILDTAIPGPWEEYRTPFANFRDDPFACFGKNRVWRCRVNLRTGKVKEHELFRLPGDFPRADERLAMHEIRHVYFAAAPSWGRTGLLSAISSLDMETGDCQTFDFGHGQVVSEAVFAPDASRSEENAGWLLSLVYDPVRRASDCVVLDAQRVQEGPVCTYRLPVSAGLTFHGSWSAEGP